jgi:hypothetical protein
MCFLPVKNTNLTLNEYGNSSMSDFILIFCTIGILLVEDVIVCACALLL